MSEKIQTTNDKQTVCYTYAVSMVVQVFEYDEESAKKKLDENGGFVSSREVVLKDAVPLYSGEKFESNELG